MLCVERADAHRVQIRLVVDQLLVVVIEVNALHAVALHKFLGLAVDPVRRRDDFHVGHLQIAFNVAFRNPAGADNADLELAGSVDCLVLHSRGKAAENGIRHGALLLSRLWNIPPSCLL